MIQRNLVNSILTSIPVMVVVNKDILSLNAQTMKSRKRETSKGRKYAQLSLLSFVPFFDQTLGNAKTKGILEVVFTSTLKSI